MFQYTLKRNLIKLNFILLGIIFTQLISTQPHSIFAQSQEDGGGDVKGNAVNSIYLTITEQTYRDGESSDIITGSIVNNSTQEVSSPAVYAVLYDKDNKLITVAQGFVDFAPLSPEGDSAFSITLFLPQEDIVDHYTLFAGGTPS